VKRELRKRANGVRKATPAAACLERSARIVQSLEQLDAIASARSVALFWPILAKHEVDLRALDESLRRRHARVAYPAIPVASDPAAPPMRMTFRFTDDVRELDERGFGFKEPPLDAPAVSEDLRELDVVVIPALGIDPAGHRIGYGAGYYDRALEAKAVTKVGVIFDFLLLPEVPATEGDVAMDWIVTDRRVLRAEPAPDDPRP